MLKFYSLHKIILAVIISGAGLTAFSSNPYRLTAGARQAGMVHTTIAIDGFWSSFHNPATLGYMDRLSLGINQDNRFGIAELSNKTFAFVLPSGKGALGAVYSYYGYSDYKRHTAGLSYGLRLGERLSAGVQVDFYSTKTTGDYQNTNEVTFDAGLLYRPVENLSLGIHVYNPIPNSFRDNNMPTVMRMGIAYYFGENFLATAEFEADSQSDDIFRFAAEYRFLDSFFLRGGVMTRPWGFGFGGGYSGRWFEANLGFITHETLGLSPSLSVVLFLN